MRRSVLTPLFHLNLFWVILVAGIEPTRIP
nr:MAG TPA: hypothetical protein [Caudoviricetes sp.]